MKFSKSGILCISTLLILSSIMFIATTFADTQKVLETDLKTAVQHINQAKFIWKETTWETIIKVENNKIKVVTNNMIFNKSWNEINSWVSSNILWGESNTITWEYDTIIAWSSNKINNANNSVILWWKGNNISKSTWSVIWWNNNNLIWDNSTIVGNNNNLKWDNSTIVGNNNSLKWDNSTAFWSWASINWGNNSFLWTDNGNGMELKSNDVFAVVSKSWMVVNTDTAHNLAQLTIGWSLVVSKSDKDQNVECNNGSKWIFKTIDKWESGKKCFCTCNWSGRNSIFWEWECQGYCNKEIPVCGSFAEKSWTTTITLEWKCNTWVLIQWSWSIYVKWMWDNTVAYWACQTYDGNTQICSGHIQNK